MRQVHQVYDEEIEVSFYLYRAGSVYYVKHNEILNSNLLEKELKYLFTSEYCLLSTFMYELLNSNSNEEGYRCRSVVDSIIQKLCGE